MLKYSLLILTFWTLGTAAFAQNVTFQVDMSNEVVSGPVRVTGDFAGWYDGKLEMTDANNDDIYDITLKLLPGLYEYKYLDGSWAGTELLNSASAAWCTKNANGNINRLLMVGESDTILPVVCFDSCMACGQAASPANVDVTFQVDMSNLGSGTTYVTGNKLDNWCGNCIGMSDVNNDLVYDVTVSMAPGFHEYKFTRGGWGNGEAFNPGPRCTVTNFGFTNRALYVPIGSGPIAVPVHPFNGCAPHDVNVYLEADLSNESVDPAGVFLSGNFNNWSPLSAPMEDLGHDIWGINVRAKAGDTLFYQVYNGSNAEAVPGACDAGSGYRMQVVPDDMPRLPSTCFGGCASCPEVLSLVWADEFNGNTLDAGKWNIETGTGSNGWGNNELQYYTGSPNNIRFNNGNLEIVARQQNIGGSSYSSARIQTRTKGDFKYGRIEASIKLPTGQGIWPAFWMMPTNSVYGGWPRSGEIDIMEMIGSDPTRTHGTIHYGVDAGGGHFYEGNDHTLPGNVPFPDAFHQFAIEWEPNEIRWYVDSVLYHSATPWEIYPCDWPFDQEFFLILNVAVGGNWPGAPDATTQFPQTMIVEYVRVYGDGGVAVDGPIDRDILVYPNPFSDEFYLELDARPAKAFPIEVVDIQGRIIMRGTIDEKRTMFSMPDQRAGLYFIRMMTDTGNEVRKLIKFQ